MYQSQSQSQSHLLFLAARAPGRLCCFPKVWALERQACTHKPCAHNLANQAQCLTCDGVGQDLSTILPFMTADVVIKAQKDIEWMEVFA